MLTQRVGSGQGVAEVRCEPGEQATGGGLLNVQPTIEDRPIVDGYTPVGWLVVATTSTTAVSVYVICLAAAPGAP